MIKIENSIDIGGAGGIMGRLEANDMKGCPDVS
jgi:hypothetical protein